MRGPVRIRAMEEMPLVRIREHDPLSGRYGAGSSPDRSSAFAGGTRIRALQAEESRTNAPMGSRLQIPSHLHDADTGEPERDNRDVRRADRIGMFRNGGMRVARILRFRDIRQNRQRNRLRRFARSPFLVRSDGGGRFLDEADSYLDSFFANVDGESRFADRLLMFVVSAATVLALFSSSRGDYDSIRITLLIFSVPALFMLFLMSVPRRK